MSNKKTKMILDDDDNVALISKAARHSVVVESRKAIAAGYKVVRNPEGFIVSVKGCAPVVVKRGGVKVVRGQHYTLVHEGR